MSKFVDDLKKDIEGMEARHEQHKELDMKSMKKRNLLES